TLPARIKASTQIPGSSKTIQTSNSVRNPRHSTFRSTRPSYKSSSRCRAHRGEDVRRELGKDDLSENCAFIQVKRLAHAHQLRVDAFDALPDTDAHGR